jgi:hypothetical protein
VSLTPERRWTRGAWLTLAAAAGLLVGTTVAAIIGLRYPSDGWTSSQLDSGAYELQEHVTQGPTPLRAGDLIVAIGGQPLRRDQLLPLPPHLHAGQVLRYSLERGGQRLEVDVTLVQRSLSDLGRYAAMNIVDFDRGALTLVPTLSFMVALAVFVLRPGSAAARYLLIIFSYYGPGTIWWGAEGHLYQQSYPLPVALILAISTTGWTWVFFPSWILLALNLPVQKWPLTRFPRLLPALLYGLPFTLNLTAAYLILTTGSAGLIGRLLTFTFFPISLAFLAALFGGLVHNFRTLRDPAARAQLRWIAFGMGVGWGVPISLALAGLLLGTLDAKAWANTGLWLTALLPIALAIAITRYRLFDIDVIIRRTLVYSVLSLILALAYFGSVLVLESVFRALTGQGQNVLVVVLSTLAIAALFGPVRGRVQAAIDRRFFRQKYDAARTLAGFAASARDETDLERLSEHLLGVVDNTMQPESVGLWLRKAITTKEPLR